MSLVQNFLLPLAMQCLNVGMKFCFADFSVGCPDTGPQVVATPVILPGSATITWQAAQTDDPLLATGMRYAVYSRCGTESSYQLVDENIEGRTYTLTSLPAPSQCLLMVVAYHRYCLRDPNGVFITETMLFITAIAGKKEQENRMTVYYASLTSLFLFFVQLLKSQLLQTSLWELMGSLLMILDLRML